MWCSIWFVDGYDRTNVTHRHLLLRLMMTACDLSDQTKSFENSKAIAVSVSLLLVFCGHKFANNKIKKDDTLVITEITGGDCELLVFKRLTLL